MKFGRLIKVSNFRHDPDGVIYVVAESDPIDAIRIVKAKTGLTGDYDDIGRVTEALLLALSLAPGAIAKT